jgi:hypothetical protein
MMSACDMENGFPGDRRPTSRRDLLSIGAVAGMAAVWAPKAQAQVNVHSTDITGALHVQGFGAAGDGKTNP